ncbi:MAG: hypothetical protein JWO74_853 [Solirubrobacterales bacterium]|nr:hypothetical protein [Solirubrobacterales bacterium]
MPRPGRVVLVQSGRVLGLREDDRLGRQAGARARKPLGFEDERAEGRESVHRELDLRDADPGASLTSGDGSANLAGGTRYVKILG